MASSADHTSNLLLGSSAAATGTSGNPIVGPHWPTTEGFVLRTEALTAGLAAGLAAGEFTTGAPRRKIPAAATEVPEPAANETAVSLTNRVVTDWIPTCFVSDVFAHVPEETVPKCTPSLLTLTSNPPITPIGG